jgi:large subunit ribosomal protein L21
MYAVVRTGGKQLRVEEGAEAVVEKLDADVGDEVSFDVLYFSDGKKRVAEPEALTGAAVKAEIVEHFKGEKVVVFKFKRRKGYKRTKGHRQELTRVRVTSITAPKGAPKKAAPAKEKAAEPEAKKPEKAPAKAEKPAAKAEKAPAKAEKPAAKAEKAPAKAEKAEPARCAAIKADGERCKNKAKPGSEYCGVHQKKDEG